MGSLGLKVDGMSRPPAEDDRASSRVKPGAAAGARKHACCCDVWRGPGRAGNACLDVHKRSGNPRNSRGNHRKPDSKPSICARQGKASVRTRSSEYRPRSWSQRPERWVRPETHRLRGRSCPFLPSLQRSSQRGLRIGNRLRKKENQRTICMPHEIRRRAL